MFLLMLLFNFTFSNKHLGTFTVPVSVLREDARVPPTNYQVEYDDIRQLVPHHYWFQIADHDLS